jgi:hypothetical protein
MDAPKFLDMLGCTSARVDKNCRTGLGSVRANLSSRTGATIKKNPARKPRRVLYMLMSLIVFDSTGVRPSSTPLFGVIIILALLTPVFD